jgi:hypothetical protein
MRHLNAADPMFARACAGRLQKRHWNHGVAFDFEILAAEVAKPGELFHDNRRLTGCCERPILSQMCRNRPAIRAVERP